MTVGIAIDRAPKKRGDQPHIDKHGMLNKSQNETKAVQQRRKKMRQSQCNAEGRGSGQQQHQHTCSISGLHYAFKCRLFIIGTSEAKEY